MKKEIILLFLSILIFNAFSQEINIKEQFTLDENQLLHGSYKLLNNSTVLIEGFYEHGIKGGRWNYYDYYGTKIISGYFYENQPNGKWNYFNKGILCSSITYRQGILSGSCQAYYDNGQLRTEFNYNNSLLNGAIRYFTPNGKLIEERFYKNGFLDSTFTVYNKNEKVLIKILFSDGIPISIIENKNIGGYHLNVKGDLVDGNGNFKLIKKETAIETPIIVLNLKFGKLHGEYITYHLGKKKIYGQIENGFLVGLWSTYDKNGEIENQIVYNLSDSITIKSFGIFNIGISEFQFEMGELYSADIMPKFLGEEISERTNFGSTLDISFFDKEKTRFDKYLKPILLNMGVKTTDEVFVKFTVNLFGEVTNVEIKKGSNEDSDIKIIDIFNNLPSFEPGFQDGFPVNISFVKPIRLN